MRGDAAGTSACFQNVEEKGLEAADFGGEVPARMGRGDLDKGRCPKVLGSAPHLKTCRSLPLAELV